MQDRHRAIILGVLWFLFGGVAYVTVAVLATVMSLYPDAPMQGYTLAYSFVIFGLPLPMVLGWVPPVYRLVKGKPRPWTSAIMMGVLAVLLPIGALMALVVLGK